MPEKDRSREESKEREKLLNLPNLLTLLRLCLVPVFIFLLLGRDRFAALLVFSLAGLTDVLDGMAARRWRLKTRIGMLLDPLADKILLMTAFLLLTVRSLNSPRAIPLWLTGTVLARDAVIVLGALALSCLFKIKEFPPSLFGKISTVFQVLTVFWVLLANFLAASPWQKVSFIQLFASPDVLFGLFYLTLFFTVLSGADYIRRGVGLAFAAKR